MKVRFLWAAVCTGVLVGVFAFAGSQAAADDPAPKLEQDGKESPGRTVFMRARCFACHGEYGYGGVGPRFRENRFLAMGDYVAGQILKREIEWGGSRGVRHVPPPGQTISGEATGATGIPALLCGNS